MFWISMKLFLKFRGIHGPLRMYILDDWVEMRYMEENCQNTSPFLAIKWLEEMEMRYMEENCRNTSPFLAIR